MLPVVRRVKIPEFELVSNPKIQLSDIKQRRQVNPRKCPVCSQEFLGLAFMDHLRTASDPDHAILEVMES